ncbi:MAG: DeoR/GlpR transcriptional regulator [Spirochaetaceae bacterium]|nr:DeoR/GlpR transcriptional regulator [Spirochaetaceae bacterium]
MTNRHERLRQLRLLLEDQEPRRIGELATHFGVSHMTIRRDAEMLAQEGLVRLLHGAVVRRHRTVPGFTSQYHLHDAMTVNRGEKERIARQAISLIEPTDTVMLDAGSTTEALAWLLDEACQATFVTYSHNVFVAIQKTSSARIILAGGEYDRAGTIFRGNGTTKLLQSIRATKAFLSAGGVSLDLGVTCSNAFEYELKRSLMEYSIHRILLVDHTKLGHTESTFYAALDEFDILVTDQPLPSEYATYCRQHGVEVLFPGVLELESR